MEELKNNEKYINLIEYLKNLGSVAVAFSGGVDSTFLLASAKEALSDNVVAFTVRSPYIPDWEINEAKQIANKLNARHIILDTELSNSILHNPEVPDLQSYYSACPVTHLPQQSIDVQVFHFYAGTPLMLSVLSDFLPVLVSLH